MMDSFISFLINHWILSSVFVVLVVAVLINEWRMKAFGMRGVNPQELVNLMSHAGAGVVDLRSEEQFLRGHILGAINIPEKELSNRLGGLSKYKSKPLVLICATGTASPKLSTQLKKEGFTQLYYLSGGMNLWQSNGMPVVNK